MDAKEYVQALWSEHPAEAQVRRALGKKELPSADTVLTIERVKVSLSELPSVWASRYRERKLKELLKVVEGEQRLLDALRAHLRSKANGGN